MLELTGEQIDSVLIDELIALSEDLEEILDLVFLHDDDVALFKKVRGAANTLIDFYQTTEDVL